MQSTGPTPPVPPRSTPVYERLVRERGDVVADVRHIAQDLLDRTARTVNFHLDWTRP
ncbi:hypothetical protein JNUCC64_05670 [Streptomyces sp. JNUCC 64]